jgi:hypothetical protein
LRPALPSAAGTIRPCVHGTGRTTLRRAGRTVLRRTDGTILLPQPGREPPALLVARHFETLARILVRAAGTPSRAATLARRRGPSGGGALFLLRLPQTAAREPQKRRVRVARLELLERGQQLLPRVGAKRRRLSFQDDRPVGVSGGHAASIMAPSARPARPEGRAA